MFPFFRTFFFTIFYAEDFIIKKVQSIVLRKYLIIVVSILFIASVFAGCIKYRKHGLVDKYDVEKIEGGFKEFRFGTTPDSIAAIMSGIQGTGLDTLFPVTHIGFYFDMLDKEGLPVNKRHIAAPMDTMQSQMASYYGGQVFTVPVHLVWFRFLNDRLASMTFTLFFQPNDSTYQPAMIIDSLNNAYGKPVLEKTFENSAAVKEWEVIGSSGQAIAKISYDYSTGDEKNTVFLTVQSLLIYKIIHNEMVEKHFGPTP